MMTVDRDLDIRRQEAAAWFARLSQRRVTTDDVKAFSAWRRDPGNARAYEGVEAAWSASEALGKDADISALTAEALGRAPPNVRARALVTRRWRELGAAAVVVLTLAFTGLWALNRPASYVTGVGEQRVVRLSDGSRVTLDTDSRITVRLRGGARSITLVAGQALFDVAADPDRPFVVTAGDARVTALGTRFDIRRSRDGARVTLIEGRVAVATSREGPDWTLSPGQQLVTSAAQPEVRAVDVARETTWTSGRLIFDKTPIAAAVAEINRYSEVRLELGAAHLAQIQVSGAFDTDDTEGFVAALVDLYGVTAKPRPDGTIVLTAPPA